MPSSERRNTNLLIARADDQTGCGTLLCPLFPLGVLKGGWLCRMPPRALLQGALFYLVVRISYFASELHFTRLGEREKRYGGIEAGDRCGQPRYSVLSLPAGSCPEQACVIGDASLPCDEETQSHFPDIVDSPGLMMSGVFMCSGKITTLAFELSYNLYWRYAGVSVFVIISCA